MIAGRLWGCRDCTEAEFRNEEAMLTRLGELAVVGEGERGVSQR